MSNRPVSVTISFIFILLNALIWLSLGIIIAANAHPALPDLPLIKGIMAFLSLAIFGILVGLFVFLQKRNRIAFYLMLALLVITALLTFVDDVGVVDLIVFSIDLIPIVLLIKDRTWYLQSKPPIVGSN